MAIGVEGQYLLKFSLGGNTDFIAERDLISFTLIEESGNTLPQFIMSFNTQDESIIPQLHEGSNFKVSFGKDNGSLVDAPLACMRIQTNPLGESKHNVTIAGLFSAIRYITDQNVLLQGPMSALEVLQSIVALHFSLKSNIGASKDSQVWIQPNTSDKKFVNELWLHADMGNSFPITGISSDGTFILKDVLKDIKNPPAWNFTKAVLDPSRDIVYDGDPLLDLNLGFMNNWVGYGHEVMQYTMETGDGAFKQDAPQPIIALTEKLAMAADVEARFRGTRMVNDNVHANYWTSALHNLTRVASFSAVMIKLSFQNRFIPIRVCDLVNFKAEAVKAKPMSSASEFNSGLYYVAKVSRSISNRNFMTTVILCRESLNQVQSV